MLLPVLIPAGIEHDDDVVFLELDRLLALSTLDDVVHVDLDHLTAVRRVTHDARAARRGLFREPAGEDDRLQT